MENLVSRPFIGDSQKEQGCLGQLFLTRLNTFCFRDVIPQMQMGNDGINQTKGNTTKQEASCRREPGPFPIAILAITIHNFPEGLAVGVTFGALAGGNMTLAGLMGAIGLAIGIGLQNVPEGAALSVPIRADGKSRIKAFYWG